MLNSSREPGDLAPADQPGVHPAQVHQGVRSARVRSLIPLGNVITVLFECVHWMITSGFQVPACGLCPG